MRTLILALVFAAVTAGCAGSDDASIEEEDLPAIVLQTGDFDGPWLQFDVGPQAVADSPPGSRADPDRFGRVGGWKSRYRRSGTAATRGPLVVESRVDLFDGDGNADDLRALEDDLDAGLVLGSGERVDVPILGEESIAATLREGEGSAALRYFLIAWRADGVTASVLVNGFDGGTKLSDALALARKQQRRVASAIKQ